MQLGAVRDFMEEMAWAGEELVGFGALFDGARFAAAGAGRDFGTCDGFEQVAPAAGGMARAGGAPNHPRPGLQAIDAAFAAGACGVASRARHEAAQKVVGDSCGGGVRAAPWPGFWCAGGPSAGWSCGRRKRVRGASAGRRGRRWLRAGGWRPPAAW